VRSTARLAGGRSPLSFAYIFARMRIAAVILVLILVAWYVASSGGYYKRLFSRESFREFHGGLSRAIAAAQRMQPGELPSVDGGTAFVTSSGLAIGVTCYKEDTAIQTLHISLSQAGQLTTHAACSRFGFFVTAMLGDMKGELIPYYTDSGVHHLVFRFQAPALRLEDFDSSYARYSSDYKPVPFRHEKMKSEQ
jgi:hypothetical protein